MTIHMQENVQEKVKSGLVAADFLLLALTHNCIDVLDIPAENTLEVSLGEFTGKGSTSGPLDKIKWVVLNNNTREIKAKGHIAIAIN